MDGRTDGQIDRSDSRPPVQVDILYVFVNISPLEDKQFFFLNNNLNIMNDDSKSTQNPFTSAQHTLLCRLRLIIVLFGVTVWHYSRLCVGVYCSPVGSFVE